MKNLIKKTYQVDIFMEKCYFKPTSKRKSYEEVEFEKAKKAKTEIMTDKTLLSYNMRIKRS